MMPGTLLAVLHRGRQAKAKARPIRTAVIFELRTEGHNRDETYWHEIDRIDDCRNGRPSSLLNLWLAETEPAPGSYRIEVSDGGWDETPYAKRAVA